MPMFSPWRVCDVRSLKSTSYIATQWLRQKKPKRWRLLFLHGREEQFLKFYDWMVSKVSILLNPATGKMCVLVSSSRKDPDFQTTPRSSLAWHGSVDGWRFWSFSKRRKLGASHPRWSAPWSCERIWEGRIWRIFCQLRKCLFEKIHGQNR